MASKEAQERIESLQELVKYSNDKGSDIHSISLLDRIRYEHYVIALASMILHLQNAKRNDIPILLKHSDWIIAHFDEAGFDAHLICEMSCLILTGRHG